MPTSFTITSPTTYGELPEGVTPIGGIVLDLVGQNGLRVVSQVPARQLFLGFFQNGSPVEFRGNPGTIGIQEGFDAAVLEALGGGLAELAVRLTIFDGDTGPGNFDRDDNTLLVNGHPIGDFRGVVTEETSDDGQVGLSTNPEGGFRDGRLDTGFFHTTDASTLTAIFETIQATGRVAFALLDADPFDNFFDFTQGLSGGLIDVGRPPTVTNQPPRIDAIFADDPIPLGGMARVRVDASDPDHPAGSLTYAFDLDGDGIAEMSGSSPTWVFPAGRSGEVTVGVIVTDPKGASATGTVTFTVIDNPPAVNPPADQEAEEGTVTSFALGSFADLGADVWQVTVDWGNGSPVESFTVETVGDLGTRDHAYAQNGDYVVTVTVADGSGVGTATFLASVRNVVPTVTAPARAPAEEGTPARFDLGRFSDPGSESVWLATVDWGDGSPVEFLTANVPGSLGALEHIYVRDGSYRAIVTVDDGRDRGFASFVVEVRNVPPSVDPPIDQEAEEGVPGTFALGSFRDPGLESAWQVTVDWGDGSPAESFTVETVGDLGTREHVYRQNGDYVVVVTVADQSGVGGSSFRVSTRNVPPALTPPTGMTVDEGTITSFALGSFRDPGLESAWQVTVDWGDGSPAESFTVETSGDLGIRGHVYNQDGTYRIVVNLHDGDAIQTTSWPVEVRNLPPLIEALEATGVVPRGGRAALMVRVSDPGIRDVLRLSVDWGDGSTTIEPISPGVVDVVLSKVYVGDPGEYRILALLEDDGGAVASQEIRVDVLGPSGSGTAGLNLTPVAVESLTLTPLGATSSTPAPAVRLPATGTTGTEPTVLLDLVNAEAPPAFPSSPGGSPSAGPDDAEGANNGPPQEAMLRAPLASDDVGDQEESVLAADETSGGIGGGDGEPSPIAVETGSGGVAPVAAATTTTSPTVIEASVALSAATTDPSPNVDRSSPESKARGGGAVMTTIVVIAFLRQRQPRFRTRRLARLGARTV